MLEWLRLRRPLSPSPEPPLEDMLDPPLSIEPPTTTDLVALVEPILPEIAPIEAAPAASEPDKVARLPFMDWADTRPTSNTSTVARGAPLPVVPTVPSTSESTGGDDGSKAIDGSVPPTDDDDGSMRRTASEVAASAVAAPGTPSSVRNYTNPDHSDLFGKLTEGVNPMPLTPAQVKAARASSARNRADIEMKIRTSSAKRRTEGTSRKASKSSSRDVSSAR